jgi:hypothetical protein
MRLVLCWMSLNGSTEGLLVISLCLYRLMLFYSPKPSSKKLDAVLYLVNYSLPLDGAERQNIERFGDWCRTEGLTRVALVWTMNATDSPHRKLSTQLEGWLSTFPSRCLIDSFDNKDPWRIIEDTWIFGDPNLQNQVEKDVADLQGRLKIPGPVQDLATLKKLLDRQETLIENLANLEYQKSDQRENLVQELKEVEEDAETLVSDLQRLKIPLTRRILLWLRSILLGRQRFVGGANSDPITSQPKITDPDPIVIL